MLLTSLRCFRALRQKAHFREKPFALQLGSQQRDAEKHSPGQSLQTGLSIVSLGHGQNIQRRKGARNSRCLHLPQFLQFLFRAVTKSVRESHSDRHLFSLHWPLLATRMLKLAVSAWDPFTWVKHFSWVISPETLCMKCSSEQSSYNRTVGKLPFGYLELWVVVSPGETWCRSTVCGSH